MELAWGQAGTPIVASDGNPLAGYSLAGSSGPHEIATVDSPSKCDTIELAVEPLDSPVQTVESRLRVDTCKLLSDLPNQKVEAVTSRYWDGNQRHHTEPAHDLPCRRPADLAVFIVVRGSHKARPAEAIDITHMSLRNGFVYLVAVMYWYASNTLIDASGCPTNEDLLNPPQILSNDGSIVGKLIRRLLKLLLFRRAVEGSYRSETSSYSGQ